MALKERIINMVTDRIGGTLAVEETTGTIAYADCFFEKVYGRNPEGETAEDALTMGLPEGKTLKLTIGAMKKAAAMIKKELDNGVELISEMENDYMNAKDDG